MKLTAFGAICSVASYRRSSLALPTRLKRVGALAAFTAIALAPAGSAQAAEHVLAGIRVFASVHDVLGRYGNPNRIITDAAEFSSTTTSGAGAQAAGGMGGSMMGNPFGRARMMGASGFPGAQSASGEPGETGATEFGGNPGGNPFGAANPYAGPGAPGSTANGSTSSASSGEVMYVYNRPGGVTYDFLLSPDGRVIQITVLGYKSSSIKTGRGIALGTLYSVMIGRYGYPEAQSTSNSILTATYLNREHASFQLRNNHVVGITVAAVE